MKIFNLCKIKEVVNRQIEILKFSNKNTQIKLPVYIKLPNTSRSMFYKNCFVFINEHEYKNNDQLKEIIFSRYYEELRKINILFDNEANMKITSSIDLVSNELVIMKKEAFENYCKANNLHGYML